MYACTWWSNLFLLAVILLMQHWGSWSTDIFCHLLYSYWLILTQVSLLPSILTWYCPSLAGQLTNDIFHSWFSAVYLSTFAIFVLALQPYTHLSVYTSLLFQSSTWLLCSLFWLMWRVLFHQRTFRINKLFIFKIF